jgi:hypothetical protein
MRIRIYGAKPIRIYADPDQTLKSQKVTIYMKNILKVGYRSKNIPTTYESTTSLSERQETGFIC